MQLSASPFPVTATIHMEKQHSKNISSNKYTVADSRSEQCSLPPLHPLLQSSSFARKKNMARLNMSELVDYDRKCCLIFCFSATHITNCLAAIHSFTLSVNSYSVKLDEAVQVTKVLLRFSAHNAWLENLRVSRANCTRARRGLGPPKDLLNFGQVKFTCLLGVRVFIITMSPQVTGECALLTQKPALHLLHCCAAEQVRTAPREGCAAPLIKTWL